MTRLCMLLILAISYLSSTFAPHGNLTSLLGFTAEPYAPLVARYSGYNNAVYFTNWGVYARNYQPQQLPVTQVTHVMYAFANIQSDGTVYSSDIYADLQKHYPGDSWGEVGTNAYGCIKQVYILKKQNRKLKVLLSIGGWTYSPNFAAAVSTDASCAKFASTAVTLMKDWGFDGTDIDWEYPADSSQASNFVLLLQAVHRALNQYSSQYGNGYHFLLTAASPAGPTHYNTEHLRAMDGVLDMWNLMAYDYAGSWDNTTGHQANLYPSSSNPKSTPFSTDRAVTDYLAAGVTPSKIQLGMPIYGRAFDNTQLPVGSSYSGLGPGSWEAGIWDYKVLPRAGATEYYDSEAGASYAYDASAKELVSYDTVRSVQAKATYLMGKNLGGTMFWEASADRRDGGSLTRHNSK